MITGDCDFLKQKAVKFLLRRKPVDEDVEVAYHEFSELVVEDFYQSLVNIGLFSSNRTDCIKRVDTSQKSKQLFSILEQIPNHSRIILVTGKEKNSSSLNSAVSKLNALRIRCQTPSKSESISVAQQIAKKKEVQLLPENIRKIVEHCGYNLFKIENTIEIMRLGEGLDLETVLATVKPEIDTFIHNLLFDQDYDQAHVAIKNMVEAGHAPLMILGAIASFCRNALAIRDNSEQNLLKLHPYLIKRYTVYNMEASQSNLRSALLECQKADLLAKSSRAHAANYLQAIISNIKHGEGHRRHHSSVSLESRLG